MTSPGKRAAKVNKPAGIGKGKSIARGSERIEYPEPAHMPALNETSLDGDVRVGAGMRIATVLELIAAFLTGAALIGFVYLDPNGTPISQVGVPGYDAFYHMKMAALLPEVGLVSQFPWLQHVYFSELDSSFISHHYGFHVLLMPFVRISHALTGDYMMGGRVAVATFFGVAVMLMQGMLISNGVRWRWMWIVVLLLMPQDFILRHSYVRAISPSLAFMLAIVLLMFYGRYIWTGVAIAAYTHLYLGSVVYTPVIVGAYVAACVIGQRGDRHVPWRLILWSTLGWLVGLRTYPYFDGALEFLRTQILGTGLDPDIRVGSEWSSYGNVWGFAVEMCGPLLAVWAAALVLRVRIGGRLNPRELCLLLLNFGFLLLTFKAKRFIEYWPMFCLLSAAYLAAPVVRVWADWFRSSEGRWSPRAKTGLEMLAALLACAVVLVGVRVALPEESAHFVAEWSTWTLIAVVFLLVSLARIWFVSSDAENRTAAPLGSSVMVHLFGALFIGAIVLAGRNEFGAVKNMAQLSTGATGWIVIAGVFLLVCALCSWAASRAVGGKPGSDRVEGRLAGRVLQSVSAVSMAIAVLGGVMLLSGDRLSAAQRDIYCGYNLPAIRDAMGYLEEVSQPGDVVFTDDWDVFPVYFYYNSYNNYIVGLDPKFTHAYEPDLWERYVKITMARVPQTVKAQWTDRRGERVSRSIHVKLEDIRDYFHAKYVVTDRNHKKLAAKLAGAKDFAELIYPKTAYEDCRDEPYLIFRVKPRGEQSANTDGTKDSTQKSTVYLSDLEPVAVTQGWGDLMTDRSVSDTPIRVGGKFFLRGIGTHAPHELQYTIPKGATTFVTLAGMDAEADERGSFVLIVEVDGKEVFRSPLIAGSADPVAVSVPVAGASRLVLRADETQDGNQWDHVDWADARFLPADKSSN